jgi:hypothetical protein
MSKRCLQIKKNIERKVKMDEQNKERLDESYSEQKSADFSAPDQGRTYTKIDREEEWPEPPKDEEK